MAGLCKTLQSEARRKEDNELTIFPHTIFSEVTSCEEKHSINIWVQLKMFLFTRRHLVFTVYIACDFVLSGVLKARDDLKVYDSALSKFLSQLIKSNPSSRKRRRRSVYATANNDVNKHFFRNNCNKNEIQFIKLNSEGLTKKSPTRDDGIVSSFRYFLKRWV